jgi:hypothetical protein
MQNQGRPKVYIPARNRSEKQMPQESMEVAPKGSYGSMSAPSKVVLEKDAKSVADMKKLFYKHNEVEDRELLKFKANEERI